MIWWETTMNYRHLVNRRNVDVADVASGHERSFAQILTEDFNFEIGFEPHRYEYNGRFYQVLDPEIAPLLVPAVKNQMEWRPLT